MVRLKVNDIFLDVIDDNGVEINYVTKDIKSTGKKFASYSKSMFVPINATSEKLFNHIYNVNVLSNYNAAKKYSATLYVDDIEVLTGYLQVDNIYNNMYEVVIATSEITWASILGDRLIYGNDDPSLNVVYNNLYSHYLDETYLINAHNSSNNVYDGYGIYYGVIDYDDDIKDYVSLRYLYPTLPSIAVKELAENIFKGIGYELRFSDDISTFLKDLYMPSNNPDLLRSYKYARYNLGRGEVLATLPILDTSTYKECAAMYTQRLYTTVDNIYIERPKHRIISYDCSARYMPNASTGYDFYANPSNSMTYTTEYGIRLPHGSITIDTSLKLGYLSDNTGVGSTYSYWLIDRNNYSTIYNIGSSTPEEGSIGYDYINNSLTINNTTGQVLMMTIDRDANDVEYIATTPTGKEFAITQDFPTVESTITLTHNNTNLNKNYDIYDLLPVNYKQKDFITSIIDMFNSYLILDGSILTMYSYDTFFNKIAIEKDWTDKVDLSQKNNQSILKNDVEGITQFKLTSDNDLYTADFNSKYKADFGELDILNDSEFAGTNSNTVQLSFAPTIMKNFFASVYQTLDISTGYGINYDSSTTSATFMNDPRYSDWVEIYNYYTDYYQVFSNAILVSGPVKNDASFYMIDSSYFNLSQTSYNYFDVSINKYLMNPGTNYFDISCGTSWYIDTIVQPFLTVFGSGGGGSFGVNSTPIFKLSQYSGQGNARIYYTVDDYPTDYQKVMAATRVSLHIGEGNSLYYYNPVYDVSRWVYRGLLSDDVNHPHLKEDNIPCILLIACAPHI